MYRSDTLSDQTWAKLCSDSIIGVAYSTGPDWHDPKVIQIWPGLAGQELRNKVTSALSYEPRTRNVVSWGFTTDLEADCGDTHDLFKLYLDPSFNGGNEERLPAAQARACFRDYLQCVRKYVEQTFEESDGMFLTTMAIAFGYAVTV